MRSASFHNNFTYPYSECLHEITQLPLLSWLLGPMAMVLTSFMDGLLGAGRGGPNEDGVCLCPIRHICRRDRFPRRRRNGRATASSPFGFDARFRDGAKWKIATPWEGTALLTISRPVLVKSFRSEKEGKYDKCRDVPLKHHTTQFKRRTQKPHCELAPQKKELL